MSVHLPRTPLGRAAAIERYAATRRRSETLTAGLSAEDQMVQSMPDASPVKWHLAHTTWFFETFVLLPRMAAPAPFDAAFAYLFNSYYEAAGPRHPRPRRGLLTRPPLERVLAYRHHVDTAMERFVATADEATWSGAAPLVELGLQHEQQHQELILTDILHAFAQNPLAPAAFPMRALPDRRAPPPRWSALPGGEHRIGHAGPGFAYDNEGPAHAVHLAPFRLASRPVTNAEFQEFVADGGYRRPDWWLADGWAAAQAEGWAAPPYWRDGARMTLMGEVPLEPDAPVCHVSYYEADAFARWAGKRLPTEAEWEVAAGTVALEGAFFEAGWLRPAPAPDGDGDGPLQMFGDVWEWTASAYLPYPGFRPAAGAVGEYNGKFMCNQMVLRGGSCATPAGHVRPSYRNFFYPHQRWQFSGFRLAEDA